MVQLVIQITVAFIALYGAILSTINLIIRKNSQKPRLKVKVVIGSIVGMGEGTSYSSGPHLFVNGMNVGEKDIILSGLCISFPYTTQVLWIPQPIPEYQKFPYTVNPGKAYRGGILIEELKKYIEENNFPKNGKFTASLIDQIDNKYTSKPFKINNLYD
jgi:hypothetical protein